MDQSQGHGNLKCVANVAMTVVVGVRGLRNDCINTKQSEQDDIALFTSVTAQRGDTSEQKTLLTYMTRAYVFHTLCDY